MSETIQCRKSFFLCISFLIIVPHLQKDNTSFSSSCPFVKRRLGTTLFSLYLHEQMHENKSTRIPAQTKDSSFRPPHGDKQLRQKK